MKRSCSEFFDLPSVWANPGKGSKGVFRPQGPVQGVRRNPPAWKSTTAPEAATFLVGFNVGHDAKWSMPDLIHLVKSFLKERGFPQDSSFVYQKGVYTHRQPELGTVTEDGARLIILKFPESDWDKIDEKQFQELMKTLAEEIADKLDQDEVIVIFSAGGIDKVTYGVWPKRRASEIGWEVE